MDKDDIIAALELTPHPTEGGYFQRTYESDSTLGQGEKKRPLLTSIYYLLSDNQPHGFLHRNRSDILHFHHLGAPIRYLVIDPNGRLTEHLLGPDLSNGQVPQLLVKGGDWKASQLGSAGFALISEAVAPGFSYEDNEIATPATIAPFRFELRERLKPFIKNS